MLIGHKVAAFYDEQRHLGEVFPEQFFVADTPCQSPHPGGLSATGFEAAVRASYEIHGERSPVVNSRSRFKRRVNAYEFQLLSRLILLDVCAGLLARQVRANHCRDEYNYELRRFDYVLILHCFEIIDLIAQPGSAVGCRDL
jgi:hypothetical protein